MKTPAFIAISVSLLLVVGCKSNGYDKGPYVPQQSEAPAHESKEPVVLMDPGVQYSITSTGLQQQQLPDGRLEIVVQLRNRENRRIEVQANAVFKDLNGFSTGDETPWQTVILTENSTEDVRFISANDKAKRVTVRVRQAR